MHILATRNVHPRKLHHEIFAYCLSAKIGSLENFRLYGISTVEPLYSGRHQGTYRILAFIEGWPYHRGFVLSTILNGDATGTKVSGRYREGGRSSGVASLRGVSLYSYIPRIRCHKLGNFLMIIFHLLIIFHCFSLIYIMVNDYTYINYGNNLQFL